MLFMVTSRRLRNGKYGDEEKPNHKFDYLYEYNYQPRLSDNFTKTGRSGFEKALFIELNRIKDEEQINTPKVGIYIHGYNNDYQDSIDEIADLEEHLTFKEKNKEGKDIQLKPVIIGFSWPSSGKTIDYLSDREECRDSVGAFSRFLLDINRLATKNANDCFSTTFCIAHSMGNYMLRKGLEYLSDLLGNPRGRKLFDETIMLAPDLSSRDMEKWDKGQYIADFSRRVHVYYSRNDRALKASSAKRFGANRLGRHGAENYDKLPPNVVFVDAKGFANKYSTNELLDRKREQVSVHSSYRYHKRILTDMKDVLSSVDREEIKGRNAYEQEGMPMRNHFELF